MTKQIRSLQEKILDAIRRGEVAMRPRWHFVLKSAMLVLGVVIVVLLAVYLASMVIFLMKQSGGWFGLGFGPRGIRAFLFSTPWILVAASMLFIFLLEILARKTEVARKTPMLYSALCVIAIVVFGTIVVDRAAIHSFIAEQARGKDIPMMRELYQSVHRDDLRRGTVVEVSEHSVSVELYDGGRENVRISEETRMPRGWTPKEGDVVVVFGDLVDDTFVAFGIRPVDPMPLERKWRGGAGHRRLFNEVARPSNVPLTATPTENR